MLIAVVLGAIGVALILAGAKGGAGSVLGTLTASGADPVTPNPAGGAASANAAEHNSTADANVTLGSSKLPTAFL